jgi:hypothetical protein
MTDNTSNRPFDRPSDPSTASDHDIERPPPGPADSGGDNAWTAAVTSAGPTSPKRRGLWKFVAVAGLGVFVVLAIAVVLAPSFLGGYAASRGERLANASIAGSVRISDATLSWTGPMSASGVQVLDPEGGTVANMDVVIEAGLLDLLLGPSAPIVVAITGSADLVGDVDAGLNLQRALAPKAASGAGNSGPYPGGGPTSGGGPKPTDGSGGGGDKPLIWPEAYDIDLVLDGFAITARQQGAGAVLDEPVSVAVRTGRVNLGAGRMGTVEFDLAFERGTSDAGTLCVVASSPDLIANDGTINLSNAALTSSWTLDDASANWLASLAGAINPALALDADQVRDSLGDTLTAAWSINGDADTFVIDANADGARLSASDVRVRVPRVSPGVDHASATAAAGFEASAFEASGRVDLRELPVALIDVLVQGDAWLTDVLGERISGAINIGGFDGTAGSGSIELTTPRSNISTGLDIMPDAVVIHDDATVVWGDPSAAAIERLRAIGVLMRAPENDAARAIAVRADGVRVPLMGTLGDRVRTASGTMTVDFGGWGVGAPRAPGVMARAQPIRVRMVSGQPATIDVDATLQAGAPFANGAASWTRDGGRVNATVRADLGAYLDADVADEPDAWRSASLGGEVRLTDIDAGVIDTGFAMLDVAPPLPEDELASIVGDGLSAVITFTDRDGLLGVEGELGTERVRFDELVARFNTAGGTIDVSTGLELTDVPTSIVDRLGATNGWGRDLLGATLNARANMTLVARTDAWDRAEASLVGRVWGRDVEADLNVVSRGGAITSSGTNRVVWGALADETRTRIESLTGVRLVARSDEGVDLPELVLEVDGLVFPAPVSLDQIAATVRVRTPGGDLRVTPTAISADPVAATPDERNVRVSAWLDRLGARDLVVDVTLAPGQPVSMTGGLSFITFADAFNGMTYGRAASAWRLGWSGSADGWLDANGAIDLVNATAGVRLESANIAPAFIGSAAVAFGVIDAEQLGGVNEALGSPVELAWDIGWDQAGLVATGGVASRHISVGSVEAMIARDGFATSGPDNAGPINATKLSGVIGFEQFPAAWLDRALQSNGWLSDIAGPTISATVAISDVHTNADSTLMTGSVVLAAQSPTATLDATFAAADGWLVAQGTPLLEWHTLTDAGSARVRSTGDVFEVVAKRRSQDEPARLALNGLRVPLDGDVQSIQGTLNIAPGDVRFRFSERLSTWIRDTRPVYEGARDALGGVLDMPEVAVRPERFQPFDVVMQGGVIRFEDATFPVGENQVSVNGTFNLANNTERLSLRVPARIVNLPEFDQSVWTQAASQGALVRFVREGPLGAAQWGPPQPQFDVEKAVEGVVREQLNDLFRRGLEDIFNRNRGDDRGNSGGGDNSGGS